jgi:hypothetical protein
VTLDPQPEYVIDRINNGEYHRPTPQRHLAALSHCLVPKIQWAMWSGCADVTVLCVYGRPLPLNVCPTCPGLGG